MPLLDLLPLPLLGLQLTRQPTTTLPDLARDYPRLIGHVLTLPTQEKRNQLFEALAAFEVGSLDASRTCTELHWQEHPPSAALGLSRPPPSPPTQPLDRNRLILTPTPQLYINTREEEHSTVIANGIREAGRGPLLFFLLSQGSEDDIQTMGLFLKQMRHR